MILHILRSTDLYPTDHEQENVKSNLSDAPVTFK